MAQSKNKSKIVAVIPCYNEGKTIVDVVSRAQKHCTRVIVVDNMSTDNTLEEVEKILPCYNIYSCPIRGAGVVTGRGLAYSLNPLASLRGDVIVTLDGDGQHNPDEIPLLVNPIQEDVADVVVGVRISNGEMPRYRQFGNHMLNTLYNIGFEYKLLDTTCGFRAFSRKSLWRLKITEQGFGFLAEILVKARALGLRIQGVPISCIYHENFEDNSSMKPWPMALSMAWAVVKWRLKLELLKKPVRELEE